MNKENDPQNTPWLGLSAVVGDVYQVRHGCSVLVQCIEVNLSVLTVGLVYTPALPNNLTTVCSLSVVVRLQESCSFGLTGNQSRDRE